MVDWKKAQTPQKEPSSGNKSTESMSPMELADELDRLLNAVTEENYDPDLMTTYLDALDQKCPILEEPNWQKAYEQFREKVETAALPEEPQTAKAISFRRLRRAAVALVAAMVLLMGTMVMAQAAGIDIFGNLARWTDETFVFLRTSDAGSLSPEYLDWVTADLSENQLPSDLYPTWWPERFAFEETDSWNDDVSNGVGIYFAADTGEVFSIWVEQYAEDFDMEAVRIEKDETPPEPYTQNDRTFYILSNLDTMTAVYSDGPLAITIGGSLSVDEMKQIIDSIGGL